MKKIKIAGLRQILGLSQIEVLSLPRRSGRMARVLSPLAENRINLEFIVVHSSGEEVLDLILGVQRNRLAAALGLLRGKRGKYDQEEIRSRDGVGMISLFPHGNRAAVIGNFLSAFREAGIKTLAVSFSLSAISGLLEETLIPDALHALSDYFELPG